MRGGAALASRVAFHPRLSLLVLRVRSYTDRFTESLLPIPALLVLGAVLLEAVLLRVDAWVGAERLPSLLQLSSEAAVQLLSTLAGAAITTAGVVFSLIVVSLQLASGQFSPRVMRGFFREPLGKVLMGLLAAVFTYSVLALKAVRPHAPGGALVVPNLTVDGAVVLTLVSVGVLVGYLQRVSQRQYVGHLLEHIAEETLLRLEELEETARGHPPEPLPDVSRLGAPHVVTAARSGWVQQVSGAGILAAVPPGGVVRLETRAGAFIVRGAPLASVWPPPARPRHLERALHAAVLVGDVRTMQEDVDFGLRQLVDVALRALSPAVNDPTTAVEAVLRLSTVLRPLLLGPLPPQVRRAPHGAVLLRPWDLDHPEYVRHAFDELRLAAAPHPHVATVVVRALRMLIETMEEAGRREVRDELERQLALTLQGCARAGLLPADLEAVHAAALAPQHPRRVAEEEEAAAADPAVH